MDKVTGLKDQDLPVLNKILEDLNDTKPTLRFYSGTPTAADVNVKELLFTDAGRIYWKQADGTLKYIVGT